MMEYFKCNQPLAFKLYSIFFIRRHVRAPEVLKSAVATDKGLKFESFSLVNAIETVNKENALR
jgi:hypothetical protein